MLFGSVRVCAVTGLGWKPRFANFPNCTARSELRPVNTPAAEFVGVADPGNA